MAASMSELCIDDFLLVCMSSFRAGMPCLGERLGFDLTYKKYAPETYKTGGGGGLGGS